MPYSVSHLQALLHFKEFNRWTSFVFIDFSVNIQKNGTLKKMSRLIFREVVGDLFSAPVVYSLAHCVAADMMMGAGIAVKFRDTFKQIENLKAQGAKAGGLAVLKDQSRFIYYLVSKDRTYTQPTYKDLFSSLDAMKTHMVNTSKNKLKKN